MTEAEWVATADAEAFLRGVPAPDCQRMLKHVADLYGKRRKRRLADRKLRLFACECSRRHWESLSHDGQAVVLQAEEFAEGRLTRQELMGVRQAADSMWMGINGFHRDYPARVVVEPVALVAAYHAANTCLMLYKRGPVLPHERWGYDFELASLIREVFGNPFRSIMCSPEWRTSTVLTLARQMYDSRDYSLMPILADALQDAGCSDEDVLNHCRGPGLHARGCWVVDLLLGKE